MIDKPGKGVLFSPIFYKALDTALAENRNLRGKALRQVVETMLGVQLNMSDKHWSGISPKLINRWLKAGTCMPGRLQAAEAKEALKASEAVAGHKHHGGSNTEECLLEFIGHKVIGKLLLPDEHSNSRITLVFDCGYGLTMSNCGTFWAENPSTIQAAIRSIRGELTKTIQELNRTLQMAGELGQG